MIFCTSGRNARSSEGLTSFQSSSSLSTLTQSNITVGFQVLLCIFLLKPFTAFDGVGFPQDCVGFAFESSFHDLLIYYFLNGGQGFHNLFILDDINLARILNDIRIFFIFALHDSTKFLSELHEGLLDIF